MITHADWQVRNSQRRYPLDDGASVTGDDGSILPESALVDASVWAPKYLYGGSAPLSYLYVSSFNVSSALVSITILGCTSPLDGTPAQFVPIASLALAKPVVPYKSYPVEPMLDGVMGWVVFGQLVAGEQAVSLAFSTPAQSMLAPKAARYYDYLPIEHASAYEEFSTVAGDIKISGEAPVVTELKDMRLAGEETDRRMLVISLQQTEDVLSEFAGLCGKRPETGNCLNPPITSIAGVRPDCDGNINIGFSPEIIIRYFRNPFYPVPDPTYPLRGGMCLDSVFSLDQACVKVQTLPDDNGMLPGEFIWKRPCDLYAPLAVAFSDPKSLQKVPLLAGYSWTDSSYTLWVTGGAGPSAELSPCLSTFDMGPEESSAPDYRTHTVVFGNTPPGSEVGIFAYDTTNTRILLRWQRAISDEHPGKWSIVKWSKALDDVELTFGSGSTGTASISSAKVKAYKDGRLEISAGAASATITLDPADVYFDPTGKVGAYIGGYHYGEPTFKPAVAVTSYVVTDTYL